MDEYEDKPKGFLARLISRKKTQEGSDPVDGDHEDVPKVSLTDRFKKLTSKNAESDPGQDLALDPVSGSIPEVKDRRVSFDGLRTLIVGRKKYTLGLFWMPETGEKLGTLAKQASGTEDGYDLVADFRKFGQVGFASKEDAVKAGHIPGAWSIPAKIVGKNWIIAVPLDAMSWWVVCMRDGVVYDDQVMKNEDEAQTVFFDIFQSEEWDRVVCPDGWNAEGSVSARVQDLLIKPAKHKIRSLHPLKDNIKNIVLVAITLGILSGGYLWYQSKLAADEAERARLAQIEAQRIRLVPANFPWAVSTPLMDFVEQCQNEIERSTIHAPNWEMASINCLDVGERGGRIEALVGSTSSSKAAHLNVAVAQNNKMFSDEFVGRVEYTRTYERASYSRPFELTRNMESQNEQPMTADQIEKTLYLRSQTSGLSSTIVSNIERVTPSQMQSRRSPVFNSHSLEIRSGFALKEIAQLFSDIPALRPIRLTYFADTMGWELEVTVYHPPITK